MVIVRGVKGNLKLNPGFKFWGGFAIMVTLITAAFVSQVTDFSDDVEQCEARGGEWVGGIVPARLGSIRSISSYCVEQTENEEAWS